MRNEDFLKRVKENTGLTDDEAVDKAINATFKTLGSRLPPVHRRHLAAQLPAELKKDLDGAQAEEYFSLEDFYGRVAARARVRLHEAIRLSHGVLAALAAAEAAGEIKDVIASLPPEFGELFQSPDGQSSVDTHSLKGSGQKLA